MSEEQSNEIYALKDADPRVWFEQGLGLFRAAEVLRDHLMSVRNVPPAARRVETLGLVHAVMLLLGLSLENAIKGACIAITPRTVTGDGMETSSWKHGGHGGHGIRNLAKSVTVLSEAEDELLNRLLEHIVWAGRYPVPTNPGRYHHSQHPKNLQTLKPSDFPVARRLLERLRELLKTGNRYPTV
jgi:hypothetical protein